MLSGTELEAVNHCSVSSPEELNGYKIAAVLGISSGQQNSSTDWPFELLPDVYF